MVRLSPSALTALHSAPAVDDLGRLRSVDARGDPFPQVFAELSDSLRVTITKDCRSAPGGALAGGHTGGEVVGAGCPGAAMGVEVVETAVRNCQVEPDNCFARQVKSR